MLVNVDGRELSRLAAEAAETPRATREQAVKAVKSASLAVEKRIKLEMPVDTGRARASWGHWTAADVVKPGPGGSGDAVWAASDDGLTITQGTNVPYVEYLNNGHSRQAPAGFIDRAQLTGQLELEKALGLVDPLDPNLQWLNFA